MTIDLGDAPTVRGPMNATPARPRGSVRRTSTIDMSWPGGRGTQQRLLGRARDLLTPADGGPPRVVAEDVLRAGFALDRTIEDIAADPPRPGIDGLVGARGGGKLRGILVEVVPEERADGTPLYLLCSTTSPAPRSSPGSRTRSGPTSGRNRRRANPRRGAGWRASARASSRAPARWSGTGPAA